MPIYTHYWQPICIEILFPSVNRALKPSKSRCIVKPWKFSLNNEAPWTMEYDALTWLLFYLSFTWYSNFSPNETLKCIRKLKKTTPVADTWLYSEFLFLQAEESLTKSGFSLIFPSNVFPLRRPLSSSIRKASTKPIYSFFWCPQTRLDPSTGSWPDIQVFGTLRVDLTPQHIQYSRYQNNFLKFWILDNSQNKSKITSIRYI